MEDAELVEAARQGDRQAFAEIYDRYADRLHAFLCTVLRDRDEAYDVLHDTFLDAGARLDQLRDPEKLRPWLFAIARHAAFRRIKRRSRVDTVAEVEVTGAGEDVADHARRSEVTDLVAAAAAGLAPRDRALLEMHLREGLEGQELADAMGVKAGHAYVLMNRLRGQLERALGALLVARHGSRDCETLAGILDGWDGRMTPLLRKRVARHTDACEECGEQRSRMLDPAVLLAALPFVPSPADLRDRVLGDVELVSHRGSPWSRRRGGFPPREPRIAGSDRGRWAAAALLVVLLGVLALLGGREVLLEGDGLTGDADEVAAGAPVPGVGPTTVPTSVPEVTTTTQAAAAAAAGAGAAAAPSPGPPAPAPPPPGPVPAPAPPADDGASTETTGVPGDTTTTTTTPPDGDGPILGTMAVRPGEIWESGPRTCAGQERPRRSTVRVAAGDPSGVERVVLRWGGPSPGEVTMAPDGDGGYSATVGPFDLGTVDRGGSVEIPLVVEAEDGAGNTSSTTGSLVLHSCAEPVPQ